MAHVSMDLYKNSLLSTVIYKSNGYILEISQTMRWSQKTQMDFNVTEILLPNAPICRSHLSFVFSFNSFLFKMCVFKLFDMLWFIFSLFMFKHIEFSRFSLDFKFTKSLLNVIILLILSFQT